MRATAIAVLALLVLASCQSLGDVDERTRVEDLRAIYTAANFTMVELSKADLISLDTLKRYNEIRKRVQALIAAADKALEAGVEVDFSTLEASLQTMRDLLLLAKAAGKDGG